MDCIISSVSPLTGATAEVIVENDCSYLYIFQKEAVDNKSISKNSSRLHSCWIKNHLKVSDTYSMIDEMRKGLQPKVPTKYCNYEDDLDILKKEKLEIVWGKEGAIASLYENGELICVIPYWVDSNFAGYSKYSLTHEVPLIPFPLGNPDNNVLFQRMGEAKEFWKQDFDLIWNGYQKSYLSELECKYGKHIKYYAIDGGNFPPKALAVFEKSSVKYAFTIGIGLFPQPKVDLYIKDYQNHELIELGFCYQSNIDLDELKVFSQISSIVEIPWAFNTFLDHHHTVDLQINTQYNNAVIVSDKIVNITESEFLRKYNVCLLWLMPITNKIYEKLIARPSDYSEVKIKTSNADITYKG